MYASIDRYIDDWIIGTHEVMIYVYSMHACQLVCSFIAMYNCIPL